MFRLIFNNLKQVFLCFTSLYLGASYRFFDVKTSEKSKCFTDFFKTNKFY